jgi:hypothetical protein
MPKKTWIRVGRDNSPAGLGILNHPDYKISSMICIGYHPDDVKRDEDELIFKGERKCNMELSFDTWARLVSVAKDHLDKCKRFKRHSVEVAGLDSETRDNVVRGLENASADIDMDIYNAISPKDSEEMTRNAEMIMVVWTEILLAEDIEMMRTGARKRTSRVATRTCVNRVRKGAALLYLVSDNTAPNFTFNTALQMMMRANSKPAGVVSLKKQPRRKSEEPKKQKTVVEEALQLASDREMACDSIVCLDRWCDVGRARVNQQGCAWLDAWDTREAHTIMQGDYLDRMDPFLGPWSEKLEGTVFEKTRPEDFYSFLLELSRRNSDKTAHSVPKYDLQLQDTIYLRDHICGSAEPLPKDTHTPMLSSLQQHGEPHIDIHWIERLVCQLWRKIIQS